MLHCVLGTVFQLPATWVQPDIQMHRVIILMLALQNPWEKRKNGNGLTWLDFMCGKLTAQNTGRMMLFFLEPGLNGIMQNGKCNIIVPAILDTRKAINQYYFAAPWKEMVKNSINF